MKKLILLMLTTLMMVGCEKEHGEMHKYEVLLPTKDTIYVDARYYESTSAFTSAVTFYDTPWKKIIRINNPVYIKEIK